MKWSYCAGLIIEFLRQNNIPTVTIRVLLRTSGIESSQYLREEIIDYDKLEEDLTADEEFLVNFLNAVCKEYSLWLFSDYKYYKIFKKIEYTLKDKGYYFYTDNATCTTKVQKINKTKQDMVFIEKGDFLYKGKIIKFSPKERMILNALIYSYEDYYEKEKDLGALIDIMDEMPQKKKGKWEPKTAMDLFRQINIKIFKERNEWESKKLFHTKDSKIKVNNSVFSQIQYKKGKDHKNDEFYYNKEKIKFLNKELFVLNLLYGDKINKDANFLIEKFLKRIKGKLITSGDDFGKWDDSKIRKIIDQINLKFFQIMHNWNNQKAFIIDKNAVKLNKEIVNYNS